MQSQLFIKASFLFSRFDLCLKTIMSPQSDISNLNILSFIEDLSRFGVKQGAIEGR